MAFKVGDEVEYKPQGFAVAVYTIIRRMPDSPAGETIYRIKSTVESCERNVPESTLNFVSDPRPQTLFSKWLTMNGHPSK